MIFDLCGDNLSQWDWIGNNFDLKMAELVDGFQKYDNCKEAEAWKLNHPDDKR